MKLSVREVKIGGWLLLTSGALFGITQLTLAWVSRVSVNSASVLAWVQEHLAWLSFVDEALMLSVLIMTVGMVLLYKHLRRRRPISSLVGLTAYGVAVIGYSSVVLALGRLVYPVNGVSISGDSALMAASQVFAGMHFAAIALGVAVIAFGVALRARSLLILSIVVGMLQIAGTYYGDTPPFWLLVTAIVGWLVWVGAVGRFMLKPEKTNV